MNQKPFKRAHKVEYHWSSGRGNFPNYGVAKHSAPFDLPARFAWNWSHPLGRFHTLTYLRDTWNMVV